MRQIFQNLGDDHEYDHNWSQWQSLSDLINVEWNFSNSPFTAMGSRRSIVDLADGAATDQGSALVDGRTALDNATGFDWKFLAL